jgi:hypothetical protein
MAPSIPQLYLPLISSRTEFLCGTVIPNSATFSKEVIVNNYGATRRHKMYAGFILILQKKIPKYTGLTITRSMDGITATVSHCLWLYAHDL